MQKKLGLFACIFFQLISASENFDDNCVLIEFIEDSRTEEGCRHNSSSSQSEAGNNQPYTDQSPSDLSSFNTTPSVHIPQPTQPIKSSTENDKPKLSHAAASAPESKIFYSPPSTTPDKIATHAKSSVQNSVSLLPIPSFISKVSVARLLLSDAQKPIKTGIIKKPSKIIRKTTRHPQQYKKRHR